MQELNQVFRPKDAPAPQQKELTATEILAFMESYA